MKIYKIFTNLFSSFNQNEDINDKEDAHEDDIVDDACQGEDLPTTFWWTNKVYENKTRNIKGISKRARSLQEKCKYKKRMPLIFYLKKIW